MCLTEYDTPHCVYIEVFIIRCHAHTKKPIIILSVHECNTLFTYRSVSAMSPAVLFLLALFLPTTWVSATIDSKDIHEVLCDYTTTSCECSPNAKVCVFNLKVRRFHSFSRYYIDKSTGSDELIRLAKLYYFNDTTGDLLPHKSGLPFCNEPSDTENCTQPHTFDGSTFRSVVGVNGQVPGPTLIVWKDQVMVVNVSNELLMETVSIHWHGMYQRNTYFMDGVHHITQNPIDPQRSFRYIFKADPPGTHWYHSHTGVQQADGLFGALIVLERENNIDIRVALNYSSCDMAAELATYKDLPQEHTIIISDWYRESGMDAYSLLESAIWFYKNTGLDPPHSEDVQKRFPEGLDGKEAGNYPFWSALINGKGKHPDTKYLKSRLHIFTVLPSEVYRFRMIGAINNYFFRFSIDEHQLWVVGTDGYWVDPLLVDYIGIHAGERYDFLLVTKSNRNKENYWMRAEAQAIVNKEGKAPYSLHLDWAAEAILHYYKVANSSQLPISSEYKNIKDHSTSKHSACSKNNQLCTMINCPWKIDEEKYNLCCRYVDHLKLLLPSNDTILPKVTPHEEIFFQFASEGVGGLSSVNGRRSTFPSVPPGMISNCTEYEHLQRAEFCERLDDHDMCNDVSQSPFSPECSCVHVRDLDYDQTYQMVYTIAGPRGTFSHPVHMHGHSFWVLKIGLPPIDSTTGFADCFSTDIVCNNTHKFGRCDYVKNPMEADYACTATRWHSGKEYKYPTTRTGKIDPYTPRKDTLVVPAGGYAVIRMVTDNPGVWFMHCHVENHLVEGMAVVLNEAKPNRILSPPEMRISGDYKPTLDDYYTWIDQDQDSENCTCKSTSMEHW